MIVDNIRAVSDKIAILIDTKGPEVRLTAMDSAVGFIAKEGDTITIGSNTESLCTARNLYTNCPSFTDDVPVGASILIDDGAVELLVTDKTPGLLTCQVQNPGAIKGKKSVNVPGVHISLPALTEKDKEFINWAIDADLDFIAHSFVRNKEERRLYAISVQNIHDSFRICPSPCSIKADGDHFFFCIHVINRQFARRHRRHDAHIRIHCSKCSK